MKTQAAHTIPPKRFTASIHRERYNDRNTTLLSIGNKYVWDLSIYGGSFLAAQDDSQLAHRDRDDCIQKSNRQRTAKDGDYGATQLTLAVLAGQPSEPPNERTQSSAALRTG